MTDLVAGLVAASLLAHGAEQDMHATQGPTGARRAAAESMIPSLAAAQAWLNSEPLGPDALRGKVVLVDFWTYTCINWRRTLPWLRAWSERYGTSGLVVIGVHSPEFPFEHDLGNVRRAVADIGVPYPIAVDGGFEIWNAFGNQVWPALYVFDGKGRLRHRQLGEDAYAHADQIVRQLLEESGRPAAEIATPTRVDARGAELPADWTHLRTPETYVNTARTTGFASPGGLVPDASRAYTLPARLGRNRWGLAGSWTVTEERAVSTAAGARVAFRFHARDVHLVMGPGTPGKILPFRVTVDGRPPRDGHGVDVDADGRGTLDASRMYHLVRQQGPIEDRTIEIEFPEAGAAAFSFTFG